RPPPAPPRPQGARARGLRGRVISGKHALVSPEVLLAAARAAALLQGAANRAVRWRRGRGKARVNCPPAYRRVPEAAWQRMPPSLGLEKAPWPLWVRSAGGKV